MLLASFNPPKLSEEEFQAAVVILVLLLYIHTYSSVELQDFHSVLWLELAREKEACEINKGKLCFTLQIERNCASSFLRQF